MSEEDLQGIRDRLAKAVLVYVPFDGWSMRSLSDAAKDEGFDPSMAERAFPKGPVEALACFSDLADRSLLSEAEANPELASMRLDARVAWLIRHRLETWSDHREALRRGIALLSLPGNALVAPRLTWHTADTIWYAAQDRSADFSYYTKRAMVGAIFTATLFYWLADSSEDSADTWSFLDRRVGDAMKVTKARRRFSVRLDRLPFRNLLQRRPARRRFGIKG